MPTCELPNRPQHASAKDRAPLTRPRLRPPAASPAADPARPLSDGAQPPANADRAVGLTERVTAPPTSWCHWASSHSRGAGLLRVRRLRHAPPDTLRGCARRPRPLVLWLQSPQCRLSSRRHVRQIPRGDLPDPGWIHLVITVAQHVPECSDSLPGRPRRERLSLRPQFCAPRSDARGIAPPHRGSAVRGKRRAIHSLEVGLNQPNLSRMSRNRTESARRTHAFLRNHLPETRTHRKFLHQIDITAEEHGEPLAQSLQPAEMIESPDENPAPGRTAKSTSDMPVASPRAAEPNSVIVSTPRARGAPPHVREAQPTTRHGIVDAQSCPEFIRTRHPESENSCGAPGEGHDTILG